VLRHVPQVNDPRVLVAAATADDAAVLRLSETRALVATVDFFTPIVDDPYAFGAIAAANAFSDVYAMGGTPLMALNLVAWPRRAELLQLLGAVLRGAGDVAREAGALVLGGHSIDDDEPKFCMTNAGARPGDRLVLTKPLGTGILSTALKRELVTERDVADAVRAMVTLNAGAAHAMAELGDAIHAATDVTGFGLLGHLRNVLLASGVAARIVAGRVPLFAGVKDLIAQGAVPGGTARNREAAARFTTYDAALTEIDRTWLSDAQTSGGLLIAVASDRADALVAVLARRLTPAAALIGTVTAGQRGAVEVVASDA
jgi:selenide,water dikinase